MAGRETVLHHKLQKPEPFEEIASEPLQVEDMLASESTRASQYQQLALIIEQATFIYIHGTLD